MRAIYIMLFGSIANAIAVLCQPEVECTRGDGPVGSCAVRCGDWFD